jgi:hypothetical protein
VGAVAAGQESRGRSAAPGSPCDVPVVAACMKPHFCKSQTLQCRIIEL